MNVEWEDLLARKVIICCVLCRDGRLDYQTVNTQINLLAGVIDGASALDQYHKVIFITAAVPYIVSHAANPEMILILRCQLLNIFTGWTETNSIKAFCAGQDIPS